MHFDTALNLVWLLLGIVGLASTIRAAIRRRVAGRSPAWLHVVGVALIIAALFPYISATDDLVRSDNFSSQQASNHSQNGKKAPNANLVRLYEILDTPLACGVWVLTLTFFAVWRMSAPALKRIYRFAPSCAGRSPPLLSGF